MYKFPPLCAGGQQWGDNQPGAGWLPLEGAPVPAGSQSRDLTVHQVCAVHRHRRQVAHTVCACTPGQLHQQVSLFAWLLLTLFW